MPHPQRFVLLVALSLCGCSGTRPAQPVLFSSAPPGALVRIDGERSGFATPCLVSLPIEKAHMVELELPGHEIARRYVVPAGTHEAVFWSEMNVGHRTPKFPLFLNIDDFFVTVITRNEQVPGRIFVRLKRTADAETPWLDSAELDEWVETPGEPELVPAPEREPVDE